MEEVLKEIQKEIQRANDASGRWYAMRNDKKGSEYLHIAVGLELAHKILVSNLLDKTETCDECGESHDAEDDIKVVS